MQAHILVLGFVQGVGFRRFLRSHAKKIGLTGWVKNLPDGRVEAIVKGERPLIEKLIVTLNKGSFFSEVKSVQVDWMESGENFTSFEIIR